MKSFPKQICQVFIHHSLYSIFYQLKPKKFDVPLCLFLHIMQTYKVTTKMTEVCNPDLISFFLFFIPSGSLEVCAQRHTAKDQGLPSAWPKGSRGTKCALVCRRIYISYVWKMHKHIKRRLHQMCRQERNQFYFIKHLIIAEITFNAIMFLYILQLLEDAF